MNGCVQGACAKNCREQTLFFEGYDEAEKPLTLKEVHTQVDGDHRTAIMCVKGKDGAFVKMMEMEYTRAKQAHLPAPVTGILRALRAPAPARA
ncbi:DUF1579 family protein [Geothrix fuzhouensis]|uniref:DUF1579 family protein n=1 Tax=Geothrix fuzhouensis TaxID=2966451 RepID=UPI00352CAE47